MSHDENAYDALTVADADARWAYGTGFEDPLAGVDTRIPDGVDPQRLVAECLALGDDALVYSQRLQEWITRLPELEEETAVANIALDLLGQARLLLARAGTVLGRTEDELAYLREPHGFRNVVLAEVPNGDFAELVARLLAFSTWRLAEFERRLDHPDPVLAAVAAKAVKELVYHREYAEGWVTRLADGTDESRRRLSSALDSIRPLVGELGDETGPGRSGEHTEALTDLLAELQSVARAYPGATW